MFSTFAQQSTIALICAVFFSGPSDEEGQFYEEEVTVTQKPFEIEVKTAKPYSQTSIDLKKSFDGSDISGETVIYRSSQQGTMHLLIRLTQQHFSITQIHSQFLNFSTASMVGS